MRILYWGNCTLWLVGHPSAASALAAFAFVWFKIGYIGLFVAVPSILLLLVAIVYCQVLKHFRRKAATVVRRTRAGTGLS